MANSNLKDIFSFRDFYNIEKKGDSYHEEMNKLESLIVILQHATDIREAMKTQFVGEGLSQNKYYILMLLNEKNDELLTPSQIAEFLSVSRGTISDLMDSMEKDELLERVICKNDRRKIQVTITEQGRSVVKQVIPKYYELTSELMSCLTAEEVENLVGITDKLNEKMKTIQEEFRNK